MRQVHTSISIAAPPDRVWRILIDFASWAEWNTLMTISGEARAGAALHFRPNVKGARKRGYIAHVIRCETGRELVWRGGPFRAQALGWGEHWFRLEAVAEGTLFEHGEDFGGLLTIVLPRPFFAFFETSYAAFNLALKTHAEAA
jgi:hypothetical protein